MKYFRYLIAFVFLPFQLALWLIGFFFGMIWGSLASGFIRFEDFLDWLLQD